jgi:predicted nucleic acid-binding protein
MRIVISDSSCLIDLRKASLLDALLSLPYEFLIPNTLFEEELIKFTAAQKRELLHRGLKVIDLPGEAVLRAQAIVRKLPKLSVHDGFAYALAENHPGCILLTGDNELRSAASEAKMEVHGILWVIDELHRHKIEPATALLAVLQAFSADPTIRLPRKELTAIIKVFAALK